MFCLEGELTVQDIDSTFAWRLASCFSSAAEAMS